MSEHISHHLELFFLIGLISTLSLYLSLLKQPKGCTFKQPNFDLINRFRMIRFDKKLFSLNLKLNIENWRTLETAVFFLIMPQSEIQLERLSYIDYISSHGGSGVEQWSVNRTLYISVDQSPLGACMIIWYQCTRFVMYVLDV